MLMTEAMVSEIPEPKQAATAGHGGGMKGMYLGSPRRAHAASLRKPNGHLLRKESPRVSEGLFCNESDALNPKILSASH